MGSFLARRWRELVVLKNVYDTGCIDAGQMLRIAIVVKWCWNMSCPVCRLCLWYRLVRAALDFVGVVVVVVVVVVIISRTPDWRPTPSHSFRARSVFHQVLFVGFPVALVRSFLSFERLVRLGAADGPVLKYCFIYEWQLSLGFECGVKKHMPGSHSLHTERGGRRRRRSLCVCGGSVCSV